MGDEPDRSLNLCVMGGTWLRPGLALVPMRAFSLSMASRALRWSSGRCDRLTCKKTRMCAPSSYGSWWAYIYTGLTRHPFKPVSSLRLQPGVPNYGVFPSNGHIPRGERRERRERREERGERRERRERERAKGNNNERLSMSVLGDEQMQKLGWFS